VTKNETREILHNLDVQQIREQVFGLLLTPGKAGGSNLIDTMAPQTKVTEQLLLQCYYSYMGDHAFTNEIRQAKQSHERFVIGILTCEVFPNLDKLNPLETTDEDAIPNKYGPKWYEHAQDKKSESSEDEVGDLMTA